jgi:hypothetical protein
MNEFDQWRENYDKLTLAQQIAYHNELEARYPEQNHFNYENVKEAFKGFQPDMPIDVLEFGTWKGDLALKCFEDFNIDCWFGIEICEAAIVGTKCREVDYYRPSRFDWFNEPRVILADIIVATHFIEHLSNEHFEALAKHCKGVGVVHFEAPLTDEGNEWNGFEGTHKLTYGWTKVIELMGAQGFKLSIDKGNNKTFIA